MDIKEIITNPNIKWVEGSGPNADIIISSRIRMARNITGIPFPHRLESNEQKNVVEQVLKALDQEAIARLTGRLYASGLEELTPWERQILVEKHLISPQHAQPGGYKAVSLNRDGTVSVMLNEEDHLRIQVLLPGLQLEEALRVAHLVDDVVESQIDYAFDATKGYLTACPTNVGTGMRASIMMHLPGLVLTKQANRVLSALSQVGLAVRGLYGEGTEAVGNLFQISNQLTLGPSEEEILNNLAAVARQLLDQEGEAREALRQQSGLKFEDRIWRNLGILKNARLLDTEEALRLLSEVRLGIDMGIIEGVDREVFNTLLVQIQPGFLQLEAGKELKSLERDALRSRIIRAKLQDHC